MPIKMLFWNIQNFSIKKVDRAADFEPGEDLSSRAEYRLNNIINTLIDTDPALFVVMEVMSDRGIKGSLLQSGGALGTRYLLSFLRHLLSQSWCVVPPLKLVDKLIVSEADDGQKALVNESQVTEGISVFYRSDRLEFIGPWIWPRLGRNDDPNKIAIPPGLGPDSEAYPPPWNDALPQGNHFAGKYLYLRDGKELWFPADTSRRPWLTRFTERNVPTPRTFTVVSCHLPPQKERASLALRQLAEVLQPEAFPLEDRELLVVGGDINLNVTPDGQFTTIDTDTSGAFRAMRQAGFTGPIFNPRVPPFSTMYKRAANATPAGYNTKKALDNLFLRAGSALSPPQVLSQLVVDRVAGNPGAGVISDMSRNLAWIQAIQDEATRNDTFRLWENYGHMGPNPGTSDHMPILIEL